MVEVVVRVDSAVDAHYPETWRHDDFLSLVILFVPVEDLLGTLCHERPSAATRLIGLLHGAKFIVKVQTCSVAVLRVRPAMNARDLRASQLHGSKGLIGRARRALGVKYRRITSILENQLDG